MRKRISQITAIVMIATLVLIAAACSKGEIVPEKTTPEKSPENSRGVIHVKIGCVPTTEKIANFIKEALEQNGNTAELVMFDANNMPATALKDGDINAVLANHKPWIEVFSRENNTDLQMVQPYYYYSPFRIFSAKHDSLDTLPDKAKVVIPNDPANKDRSIRMLSEVGLVKLSEKKGDFYTPMDIVENPKNIELVEVEVTTIGRNINDADIIFSMAFIAQQTGNIDPNVFLYEDPQSPEFQMGLIVRGEDADAQWAVEAMQLLHNEEFTKKFNDTFQGAFTLFE